MQRLPPSGVGVHELNEMRLAVPERKTGPLRVTGGARVVAERDPFGAEDTVEKEAN